MKAGGQGPVKLAVKTFGESGAHRIVILHSLFGRKEDWGDTGERLAASASARVEVADLRCHGESEKGEFSLIRMAEDTVPLVGGGCLVGHGLGGRAAMRAALTNPAGISRLAVIEASPVGEIPGFWSLAPFLGILAEVPLSKATSHKEAAKLITLHLAGRSPPDLIPRLIHNLLPLQQGFTWGFDVTQIRRDLELIRALPLDGVSPYPHPALFVSADMSDALHKSHHSEITKWFPQAVFYKVLRSGFFINEHRPLLLNRVLSHFISTNSLPKENIEDMEVPG